MYVLTCGHALVKTLPLYQLMDGGMETKERMGGWRREEGVMDGGGVESLRWSNWWRGTEIRRRRQASEQRHRGDAGCVCFCAWLSLKGRIHSFPDSATDIYVLWSPWMLGSVWKSQEGIELDTFFFSFMINHSLIRSRRNKNPSHLSLFPPSSLAFSRCSSFSFTLQEPVLWQRAKKWSQEVAKLPTGGASFMEAGEAGLSWPGFFVCSCNSLLLVFTYRTVNWAWIKMKALL